MPKTCNFLAILLFLVISQYNTLVIRRSPYQNSQPMFQKPKHHKNFHRPYPKLDDNPYIAKPKHRHLDEFHRHHTIPVDFSITHSLHLADFFIVIVAVFIGVLILEFLKPLLGFGKKSNEESRDRDPIPMGYAVPGGYPGFGGFRARKLVGGDDKERLLRSIGSKIHKGESKVAAYINRVLFNKHNVYIPKGKLFKEVLRVRKYFDKSGLSVPDTLTERNLYQITRNVFWNIHHYNIDKKKSLAKKAVHTLYSHRGSLFNTFIDSIKGV